MTHSWSEHGERGGRKLTFLGMRLILALGRRFGSFLCIPVSLYFFIFSKGTAQFSRDYLRRALGRKASFFERYKHYRIFATTIMDRLFFFSNRFGYYDIDIKGRECIERHVASGNGCILLGAHLGSFDVLRAFGTFEKGVPIKALYNAHNSEIYDAVINEISPEAGDQLIHMGSPNAMLQVREFVAAGGLVGILGDRAIDGGKVQEIEFLGGPASFPIWPFRLASAIGCPVILFFGLFRGANRYEIIFEPFTDKIDRANISDDIQRAKLVEAYAERIEHHCRKAPFNWFNFFDYWKSTDDRAVDRRP